MVILFGMEMGIVEAGVSLLHPSILNQIGIDFGTRGAKRLGGGPFSPIGLDDISKVLVAQGVMAQGMLHGGQDLGFTVEIDQFNNLFDLMGQMQFGLGQGFYVLMGRIPQGQQGIPVLKISAMGS